VEPTRGQNPACSGTNANKVRQALTRLDWLVNVNIFPSETGRFWQDKGLGLKPEEIKTEVFMLPAAASVEKEGSITNSGRWMQWRYKAADAPGDAKPDAEIMNMIYRELKMLYTTEGGTFPDPITNLKWDYFEGDEFDPHAVAKEVNGYFLEDVDCPEQGRAFKKGERVPGFSYLRDDGTTSSGNWLYCGSYPQQGNLAARRTRESSGIGLHPQWSWSWPANRRILYNRASVDLDGQPYNKIKPVIRWEQNKWLGDIPDGGAPPLNTNPENSYNPFIMKPEGTGRLFAMDLEDGPLPEHYEPLESPLLANPFNGCMLSPAVKRWHGEADVHAEAGSREFPYVCTTFRLAEHWQTGVMTRHTPWLLELQPQIFIEMGMDLAHRKGIKPGSQVRVTSKRGAVTAFALPTSRLQPLVVDGREIQQVGLPWCFGWLMPTTGSGGDSANLLTPNIGDANTLIPETKVFMVNIEKLDVMKNPELAL
jgi:formate dehydrogenase major subunit